MPGCPPEGSHSITTTKAQQWMAILRVVRQGFALTLLGGASGRKARDRTRGRCRVASVTVPCALGAAPADVRNGNDAAAVVQHGTKVVVYYSGANQASASSGGRATTKENIARSFLSLR